MVPDDECRWSVFEKLELKIAWSLFSECELASETSPIGTTWREAWRASRPGDVGLVKSLAQSVATLHAAGVDAVFAVEEASCGGASVLTLQLERGLTLDTPALYTDARVRPAWIAHIRDSFEIASVENAAEAADRAAVLETSIAAMWRSPAERRVGNSMVMMSVEELEKAAPGGHWAEYIQALGVGASARVGVSHPPALAKIAEFLASPNLGDYLLWKALCFAAPFMGEKWAVPHERFFCGVLGGALTTHPPWRRAVTATCAVVPKALSAAYARRVLSRQTLLEVDDMMRRVFAAMRRRLLEASWLSEKTRFAQIARLDAMRWFVGSDTNAPPERTTKDLSLLGLLLVQRAVDWSAFVKRINTTAPPLAAWPMSSFDVNACYRRDLNALFVPAAVLQPPFFDTNQTRARNYGALGVVLAHEVSHAFDDESHDGWAPGERAAFEERARVLVEQANARGLDGKLTLGENLADASGLCVSLEAMRSELESGLNSGDHNVGSKRGPYSSQDLAFFESWAMLMASESRPEDSARRIRMDPHAPGWARVAMPLLGMPSFYKAFGV